MLKTIYKNIGIASLLVFVGMCANFPKITYEFGTAPIDVVIPCTEKDLPTLELCIDALRTYAQGIRRIIVVSRKKFTEKAEWFDERYYPFSKYDVAWEVFNRNHERAVSFIEKPGSRCGWLYQQLLKLYAPFVIPEISSNLLIVDADVIFFKPVSFLTKEGAGLYNPGNEPYHVPYFQHMAALVPGLRRVFPEYSGITHHMLFQRPVVEDLFATIQRHHGIEPWRAICKCISHVHLNGAFFSEYETYFNFVFSRTNQVKIRVLKWENTRELCDRENQGYDYLACHAHLR